MRTSRLAGAVAGLVVAVAAVMTLAGCSGSAATQTAATTGAGASTTPAVTPTATGAPVDTHAFDAAIDALETQYGAEVGVAVLDTGTGTTFGHRADERFAFASTSKALTAGLVLRTASDADLDAIVHYDQSDLLSYAPITSQHVATGMSLRDVVAAALQYSDNTAANLLTEHLGGPAAVQSALRALGDRTTNVDRTEPDLNEATPGDDRDTTTTDALAADLRGFAVGRYLTPDRRAMLDSLLAGNTTGGPYIRAGVPAGWQVGDKTGNAGYGTRNDIAVVTPPGRAPIVLVVLTNRGTDPDATSDDGLIADVTRQVVQALP